MFQLQQILSIICLVYLNANFDSKDNDNTWSSNSLDKFFAFNLLPGNHIIASHVLSISCVPTQYHNAQ